VAKKKSSKKRNSPIWQWVIVGIAAYLVYQGLEHFLPTDAKHQAKKEKETVVKIAPEGPKEAPAASPKPETKQAEIKKWNFSETSKLLPEGAYPDNYEPLGLKGDQAGLIAYAKTLPGKKPGPKGLTNTQPALRFYFKKQGQQYQGADLDLADLKATVGESVYARLSGLPQVDKQAAIAGATEVFPVKLFLSGDSRVVQAYLAVGEGQGSWAKLSSSKGEPQIAAFVQGTTRLSTSQSLLKKEDGKNYLVFETGKLNEAKLYEGYQWEVKAYRWEGDKFAFDPEMSEKLLKEKKSAQ